MVKKKKEATIVETKKFTIEVCTNSNGTQTVNRINEGFNEVELIGLLFMTQINLVDNLNKKIIP